MLLQISTLGYQQKEMRHKGGGQGKSMMHALLACTCCGMPKGTCRAEVTSNGETIKPVALAIIELRLSEGIRQAGGQVSEWVGRWAGRMPGGKEGRPVSRKFH